MHWAAVVAQRESTLDLCCQRVPSKLICTVVKASQLSTAVVTHLKHCINSSWYKTVWQISVGQFCNQVSLQNFFFFCRNIFFFCTEKFFNFQIRKKKFLPDRRLIKFRCRIIFGSKKISEVGRKESFTGLLSGKSSQAFRVHVLEIKPKLSQIIGSWNRDEPELFINELPPGPQLKRCK